MAAEVNMVATEMNMAAEGNGSEQERKKKHWEIDTSQVPQLTSQDEAT